MCGNFSFFPDEYIPPPPFFLHPFRMATSRKRPQSTEIANPEITAVLCRIQQEFVRQWNHSELNSHLKQSHDLPSGAEYSGGASGDGRRFNGASFRLSSDTWVCIHATRDWNHWHDGWSFCRHELSPLQVKKVVVRGSMDEFTRWLASVTCAPCT